MDTPLYFHWFMPNCRSSLQMCSQPDRQWENDLGIKSPLAAGRLYRMWTRTFYS